MRSLLPFLVLISFTVGCTFPAPTPTSYQRTETGGPFGENYGEVIMVRTVPIAGETSAVGRMGGMYAGAVIGSTVGDGLGRVVASSVGAAAGVVAGEAAEERVRRTEGLEISVQLDGGQTVSIVQDADVEFVEGERVRVLMRANDTGRVVKY